MLPATRRNDGVAREYIAGKKSRILNSTSSRRIASRGEYDQATPGGCNGIRGLLSLGTTSQIAEFRVYRSGPCSVAPRPKRGVRFLCSGARRTATVSSVRYPCSIALGEKALEKTHSGRISRRSADV